MTQYIGIDAYSKTCTAVVTYSKGNILKKQVFATSERNLLDFVDSVKRPRILAIRPPGVCSAKNSVSYAKIYWLHNWGV